MAHPAITINPLRALYYAVVLTYLPHVLRIPLVFRAQSYYDNLHPCVRTCEARLHAV